MKTPRIFDIQGLRDIEYDESLRIDKINDAVTVLSTTLRNTANMNEGEVNSIVQLLGLQPAQIPSVEVSTDTSLLLKAISDIGKRLTRLEDSIGAGNLKGRAPSRRKAPGEILLMDLKGHTVWVGGKVRHPEFGDGVIQSISKDEIEVDFTPGPEVAFKIPGKGFDDLEPIVEET